MRSIIALRTLLIGVAFFCFTTTTFASIVVSDSKRDIGDNMQFPTAASPSPFGIFADPTVANFNQSLDYTITSDTNAIQASASQNSYAPGSPVDSLYGSGQLSSTYVVSSSVLFSASADSKYNVTFKVSATADYLLTASQTSSNTSTIAGAVNLEDMSTNQYIAQSFSSLQPINEILTLNSTDTYSLFAFETLTFSSGGVAGNSTDTGAWSFNLETVPEPSTLMLLALGSLGLLVRRKFTSSVVHC
jgi:hypothetical protein